MKTLLPEVFSSKFAGVSSTAEVLTAKAVMANATLTATIVLARDMRQLMSEQTGKVQAGGSELEPKIA